MVTYSRTNKHLLIECQRLKKQNIIHKSEQDDYYGHTVLTFENLTIEMLRL